MSFPPPDTRLYDLVQEAMDALYTAEAPAAFDQQVEKLRRTLAADKALPDEALVGEKQRFLDNLADTHSREPRVYVGESTLKVWEGIMRAIDEALADRHKRGKPTAGH